MPSVAELIFDEQFGHLQAIAVAREWPIEHLGNGFTLGLTARDGETYWLRVDCANYPAVPPAWYWWNPVSANDNQPVDTPKGSGFLHSSGRICAPWNRLAYKQADPEGPHGDWDLANWMQNPKTGSCTTLSAMALRLHVELMNKERYKQRTVAVNG